jgi:hypothetical protein
MFLLLLNKLKIIKDKLHLDNGTPRN